MQKAMGSLFALSGHLEWTINDSLSTNYNVLFTHSI